MSAGVACMWSAWAPGVRRCCSKRASAVPPTTGRACCRASVRRRALAPMIGPVWAPATRPGVHDAGDEIKDLATLLDRSGIKPPYVLVGHSYGGLLVRLFARAHPHQTVGIVLVDAVGRDAWRRDLAAWPKSLAPNLRRRFFAHPVDHDVDLGPVMRSPAASAHSVTRRRSSSPPPTSATSSRAPRRLSTASRSDSGAPCRPNWQDSRPITPMSSRCAATTSSKTSSHTSPSTRSRPSCAPSQPRTTPAMPTSVHRPRRPLPQLTHPATSKRKRPTRIQRSQVAHCDSESTVGADARASSYAGARSAAAETQPGKDYTR